MIVGTVIAGYARLIYKFQKREKTYHPGRQYNAFIEYKEPVKYTISILFKTLVIDILYIHT